MMNFQGNHINKIHAFYEMRSVMHLTNKHTVIGHISCGNTRGYSKFWNTFRIFFVELLAGSDNSGMESFIYILPS
jgi:hypothetical protein